MNVQREPEFMPYSQSLNQEFSAFIDSSIRADSVGAVDATRLLEAWPDDADRAGDIAIKNQLSRIAHGEAIVPSEVYAASLRIPEDFQPRDDVSVRLPVSGSNWHSGVVSVVNNELITINFRDRAEQTVLSYSPGLFRRREMELLDKRRHGSGHQNLAHFVVKLSFFDERFSDFEDQRFINGVARSFGCRIENIPRPPSERSRP